MSLFIINFYVLLAIPSPYNLSYIIVLDNSNTNQSVIVAICFGAPMQNKSITGVFLYLYFHTK